MPYGPVFTTSNLKQQLAEMNRDYLGRKTWEELYGNIAFSEQKALASVDTNYSSAIGEAYMSSLQQEQNILSSNLGQGYKDQALLENEMALEEAFASYQQNYLQNKASVLASTTEATEQVTSALTTQAENTVAMANSAYDYLSYLYKEYGDTDLFKDINWSKYLNFTPVLDAEGNQQYDEEGNLIQESSLKTWEQLVKGNESSRGLFDENNNLTITGADFYDQIMNEISSKKYGEKYKTYGAWLEETNPELFEWSRSYNPYNYNPYIDAEGNMVNSNIGSFRTMFGMTSGDETYAFIERYGGMTEKQINNLFTTFQKDFDNINFDDPKEYASSLNTITQDIKSLTASLGIEEEIGEALGGWNNLTKIINTYVTNAENTEKALDAEYYKKLAGIAATTGATSAALAFIPFIGGFASALTVASGAGVAAGVTASYNEHKKQARQNNAKQAYTNMIQALITAAQSKRREKEIEFNNLH